MTPRETFLRYLSNLTPQAIFLALSIVLLGTLDTSPNLSTTDWIIRITFSILCVLIFLAASVANITLFVDDFVNENEAYKSYSKDVNSKPIKGVRKTVALLGGVWKHDKLIFFKVVAAVIVVEVGFIAVVVLAVKSALAIVSVQSVG